MRIDPASLTDTARTIVALSEGIKDPEVTPQLRTADLSNAMKDSQVAFVLQSADDISFRAKTAIERRYQWMAHLLYVTAKTFLDVDTELANDLNSMGELNLYG